MRRVTSVQTPVAHLVGPGRIKVVNGQLAYVALEQGPLRLDPAMLRAVYCYGAVSLSDEALYQLFENNIEVSFLTPSGTRCRGRLVKADPSRTTLRMLQHEAFRSEQAQRDWAARVVSAKIGSQMQAARHYQRQGRTEAGPVVRRLQEALGSCAPATLEQLRGIEGAASAQWFDLMGQLLQAPWRFERRSRRPPRDPVNALLSLGYTWLLWRTVARCEAEGLEVNLGGLHEYRPGRPSLACDLMEPLRASAVDRWVLWLCNQQMIGVEDFAEETEGTRLQEGRFGRILHLWEQYWQDQQQEAALDGWVTELLLWLRQGDTAPLDGTEEVPAAP